MSNVTVIKAQKDRIDRTNGVVIERLRTAAYCRVSTDSSEQLLSYKSQVEHYTNFINSKPDWILTEIYADEGITGTLTNKRLDFQRMIIDATSGKIDLIITKAISRFARNTLDTLKYVRELKSHNVGILFEKENINTLTMDGEMLLTILSSLAQQESESISQNVKMGLRMKMLRGEMIGFQGCLGYDYDIENKTLSINEDEAEIVRYIFKRYNEGIGCFVIAKELTTLGYQTKKGRAVWGDTAVRGILKNEKYKGDLLMGKTFTTDPISKRRLANFGEEQMYYIKDHHTAIISAEEFDKALIILAKRSAKLNNKGRANKYSRQYPFSSKIRCGFCDSSAGRRKWHSKTDHAKDIWHCITSTKKGKKYCQHSKGLEEIIIESAFVDAFNMLCKNNKNIIDDFLINVEKSLNSSTKAKELKKLANELSLLENKLKKLADLQIDGIIDKDTYEIKYGELIGDIDNLRKQKLALEVVLDDENSVKARLETFKKLFNNNVLLEEFDPDVFESIVDEIILGGYDDDIPNPFILTFVFKTGFKETIDISDIKKNGSIKPCSHSTIDTR